MVLCRFRSGLTLYVLTLVWLSLLDWCNLKKLNLQIWSLISSSCFARCCRTTLRSHFQGQLTWNADVLQWSRGAVPWLETVFFVRVTGAKAHGTVNISILVINLLMFWQVGQLFYVENLLWCFRCQSGLRQWFNWINNVLPRRRFSCTLVSLASAQSLCMWEGQRLRNYFAEDYIKEMHRDTTENKNLGWILFYN